ncbi:MAG: hypothetical protein H6733_14140 [Alphaproteobacteria bacterium]|nr:hypothetical protein [Alphaproteobacteria bacterium]
MPRSFVCCLLWAGCAGDIADAVVDTDGDEDAVCVPSPPDAMLARPGWQDDGSFLDLDGRRATPYGPSVTLPGFAGAVVAHPTLPIAYVATTGMAVRDLLVVDTDAMTVVQTVSRSRGMFGLTLTPDGSTLLSTHGAGLGLDRWTVQSDGTLADPDPIALGVYASGLALSDDGRSAWVGGFLDGVVVEVDLQTATVTRTVDVEALPWDLAAVPGRHQLWVGDLYTDVITVIDTASGAVVDTVPVPMSTGAIVATRDGSRVYVAAARDDVVLAFDGATRAEVARGVVAAEDPEADGPLPNSNVNGLILDEDAGRIYATRGTDNAVAVLDLDTLDDLGAIPGPAYPTAGAVTADGGTLLVTGGHGGIGPNRYPPDEGWAIKKGSLAALPLDGLDLAAATAEVVASYRRPVDLYDFDCPGTFPVPTRPGAPTPIEHVVLIVKENKTFDCYFGDLGGDADGDPGRARFGEAITPNLHALARRYALSDNFYHQVDDSDQGHIFLTQGHLTELAVRANNETEFTGSLAQYPVSEAVVPTSGTLFSSLLDHDVDFRVWGEIVGMFHPAADGRLPNAFSDFSYPGGPFLNLSVEDDVKAEHVVDKLEEEGLPTFSFMLFPRDHTVGPRPGGPTPEAMVADSDKAVGIVLDHLSHRPEWMSTVVFIVQDDPQMCDDHVDAHRSYVLVASPWARRGYVSHVQASFLSMYATITRLLGIPPLGRGDANAAPLWDLFTQEPDDTPFELVPSDVPDQIVPEDVPGAAAALAMDFRGPDRNPELGELIAVWQDWRSGRLSRAEAEARVAHPVRDPERWARLVEEAEEDGDAFAEAMAQLQAWQRAHGLVVSQVPEALAPQAVRVGGAEGDVPLRER